MPNKNKPNKKASKQRQWGNALSLAVFLLLLLILCGLIYAWYLAKHPNNYERNTNVSKSALSDGLPRQIFAYSGTVKEINKQQGWLTLFAPRTKNYLLKDETFKVYINDKTKFKKLVIPKKLPQLKPGETGSYYTREDIKLTNIKIGDQITAIATENIKNKTEFTAAQIEKIKP